MSYSVTGKRFRSQSFDKGPYSLPTANVSSKSSNVPFRVRKSYKAMRALKGKASLVKTIKNVVDRMAEDKTAYTSISETTPLTFNSAINNTAEILQLVPNIAPGSEENQRIGDRIKPKRLSISGYVRVVPNVGGNIETTARITQVAVRLFVVSLKSKANFDDVASSATPLASLLKKGGTNVGFTGLISDIQAEVNTDLWTVHEDRVMYLTQTYNNFATQVGYWETDISKQIQFFNFDLAVKSRTFNYDDSISSGLQPTNYAPIMLLGYSYLNGGAPDTVATNVGLFYQSTLKYQDM